MQGLYKIKDMLCDELEELASKGTLSAGDLETVHKLTDTIKNIYKIEMHEDDHSRSGGHWNATGDYGRSNNSYDNGNSYSRHYVRGHYSRDDGRNMMEEEIDRMMSRNDLSGNDRNALSRAKQLLNM